VGRGHPVLLVANIAAKTQPGHPPLRTEMSQGRLSQFYRLSGYIARKRNKTTSIWQNHHVSPIVPVGIISSFDHFDQSPDRWRRMQLRQSYRHSFPVASAIFCNSLLFGVADYLLQRFQSVQNAAARLITRIGRHAHHGDSPSTALVTCSTV